MIFGGSVGALKSAQIIIINVRLTNIPLASMTKFAAIGKENLVKKKRKTPYSNSHKKKTIYFIPRFLGLANAAFAARRFSLNFDECSEATWSRDARMTSS